MEKNQKASPLETTLLFMWLADLPSLFANRRKSVCINPQSLSLKSFTTFAASFPAEIRIFYWISLLWREGKSCRCWQITRANRLHVTTTHIFKSASPGVLKALHKPCLILPYRGQSKEIKALVDCWRSSYSLRNPLVLYWVLLMILLSITHSPFSSVYFNSSKKRSLSVVSERQ